MKTFFILCSLLTTSLANVQIAVPANPRALAAPVNSNFLGISFELSYLDQYFGGDPNSIPPTMLNYLAALRSRTQDHPLRLRIGGNAMDVSTYVPNQKTPMLERTHLEMANYQAANFGPLLFDVLNAVADNITKAGTGGDGANYLFGLSLRDPANPNIVVLAGDSEKALGSRLDAFLLGNEPDLYTSHRNRPNLANYTTNNYIQEFSQVSQRLKNTSAGDVLAKKLLAGPTICCFWNLDRLLDDGYLSNFTSTLKYTSLQHYPQNNCFGTHAYDLPYYIQHANAVALANWQRAGINLTLEENGPPPIMSEFNSAACGGVPGVSNTFGVGGLWVVDYSLQLASIGYGAAYIHTRERGISYNVITTPEANDTNSVWVTNPSYYALLATSEALQSKTGAIVVNLNPMASMTDTAATVAAYAVHDAKDQTVQQLVLFNYASNSPNSFTLPSTTFAENARKDILVKFLFAKGSDANETISVSWGGQTLEGASDGRLKTGLDWIKGNVQLDCTDGCTVDVPPTTMAVVFANGDPQVLVDGLDSETKNNSAAALPSRRWGPLLTISLFTLALATSLL